MANSEQGTLLSPLHVYVLSLPVLESELASDMMRALTQSFLCGKTDHGLLVSVHRYITNQLFFYQS